MDQEEELIRGIRKGLLAWYDFEQGSRALYIGHEEDALAEVLREKSMQVICVSCEQICLEKWRREYAYGFDYIVCIAELEQQLYPEKVLCFLKEMLKSNGRILLGMNNRLGIRYFCGDRDIYTERSFDGIEGYRRVYSKKEDRFQGRCYSREELKEMLRSSGWTTFRFYSVLSDLDNPGLIYAEDYLPNEDLAGRVFPTYHYPDSVFLEEYGLYDSLVKNGLFHLMANAYLIEVSPEGRYSDVKHVTSSMERGRRDAMYTIIRGTGIVEKRAAYPEGQERLRNLVKNGMALAEHGISVVDAQMKNGVYVMPYIHGEVAQIYLKKLLQRDKKLFLQKMDFFRDLILQSSEIVESDSGDGRGTILSRGYLDMVPLNSFYIDGTFVFYDQEFCERNYPANVIILRMIACFYSGNIELEKILPREELFERYGLIQRLEYWKNMEWRFMARLRNEKVLGNYHYKYRSSEEIINSNRQRINFSTDEYQRLFVDIFPDSDTCKLILFGSGNFAKRFLAFYGQDYPVYAVIDNNMDRWGVKLEGVSIQSPEILGRMCRGEYKVLICIKDYLSVVKQLEAMGVTEYGIFDPNKEYPRKKKPIVQCQEKNGREDVSKKYHTGYIAGVFDLFHIGHLNMFKRAKEQCNYLIVGVVTDEGARKFKGIEPFIPFEERIEMVRACRYVDEAVEIPLNYSGTKDAYLRYRFDCQFSGSDYVDDPSWLSVKAFLEKNGAELVFFPYTESTSSTKIKLLIEKKLM